MNPPTPEQFIWLRQMAENGHTEQQMLLWLHERLAVLENAPRPQPAELPAGAIENLSRVARVILGAYRRAPADYRLDVAAAIDALADQAGSAKHWHVDELRAIAAELEGEQ